MYIGTLRETVSLNENKYFRKAVTTLKKANTGQVLGAGVGTGLTMYKAYKDPFKVLSDPKEMQLLQKYPVYGARIGGAIGTGKGLYDAIKDKNSKNIWNKNDPTMTKFKKGAKFIGRNGLEMGGEILGGSLGGGFGAGLGTASGPIGVGVGSVAGVVAGSHIGGKVGKKVGDYVFGKEAR